jgi:hypothetical protein
MHKVYTKLFFSFLLCLSFQVNHLKAQEVLNEALSISWEKKDLELDESGTMLEKVYAFENGCREPMLIQIPFLNYTFQVQGPGKITAYITENETQVLDIDLKENLNKLDSDFTISKYIEKNGDKYFARISILPAKLNGTSIIGLASGTLKVNFTPGVAKMRRGPTTVDSKLASGTYHKISVAKSGIFKVSAEFLQTELNLDLNTIDPKKIKIYGHGGGRLPLRAGEYTKEDLPEIPIWIPGESDNSFDSNDNIYFYAEGPNSWRYDEDDRELQFEMNTYSNKNYYFIQFDDSTNGLRINIDGSVDGETDITSYDVVSRLESDQYNILDYVSLNQGSGQDWFGDLFKNLRTSSYSFSIPNLIVTDSILLEARFASRASTSNTTFELRTNGQTASTGTFPSTTLSNSNSSGAKAKTLQEKFLVNGTNFTVEVNYPEVANSTGWLDYIEARGKANLTKGNGQLTFQSYKSLDYSAVNYKINSSEPLLVWDISNPCLPSNKSINSSGSTKTFGSQSDVFKRFIAFNTSEAYSEISYVGIVANQNLHGMQPTDMIIISPEVFMSQANRLAEHRSNNDDLSISIVQPTHIFNEFSSGKPDAAAIRNFLKHIYEKNPTKLKYVLLLGDGSFDNRNILGLGNNFIITYETEQSLAPIYAYPSDDYFGLTDDDEGTITQNSLMNIAIGRLPVKSTAEASAVVDKIIRYDDKLVTEGDWKNWVVFVGDDEDSSTHSKDSDKLAKQTAEKFPWINQDKIYIDAFEQESTSFGTRVPGAREAINNSLFKGALSVTYLGHGGSIGWAQERILQMQDIISFNNTNKLPVFLTATCSFAGYDDPKFTSGGEETILNPNGGAISMFTTVRAVLANDNYELSRAIIDTLYTNSPSGSMRFGDAMNAAKNNPSISASNHRKFTLLGDPSQQISIPSYEVLTTEINGNYVAQNEIDTISSLELVQVKGKILDFDGSDLNTFNGKLYITVFDKKVTNQTLGQDSGSPIFNYDIQKNIIFKGLSSVVDGQFQFEFVVPKDISFEFGNGKISYYAIESNGNKEAKGSTENIIIGGSSENAIVDDQGPEVEVYMNNENFVFGGITSSNPILYVKLKDDNGINIVGNSIGHDLTGTLDENTQNSFLLNEYYQSELDNYKSGIIRYPLADISEGRHQVKVKAWDIANNSSEGYTEFVVSSSGAIALQQVLNYPNPFINSTCFQFEHNMQGQNLDIQVQIFSISGKLVKTIETQILSNGSRLGLGDCIQWDGKDDFGSDLAKGVYVYKIKAQAQSPSGLISGESAFEKLVILK